MCKPLGRHDYEYQLTYSSCHATYRRRQELYVWDWRSENLVNNFMSLLVNLNIGCNGE